MVEQQTFSLQRQGDTFTATVHMADFSAGVTDMILTDLQEALGGGMGVKLAVELTEVKFMDSVALGSLVVLLRRIKHVNGRLALVGVSGHCLKVMQVTGLDKVFEMYSDLPKAIAAFTRPTS
jgi:anti-sigma B factor antagonist